MRIKLTLAQPPGIQPLKSGNCANFLNQCKRIHCSSLKKITNFSKSDPIIMNLN